MSEPSDAPKPPLGELGPGAMIGGYRIERVLGQGGVGTVFAAVEPTIKKRVAVKVLRRELVADEETVLRFEREARAVNEIRHAGIVDVLAIGKLDDGRPYLVMSLLEGESLRALLERDEQLAPREAWRIAREIALALEAAHAAGVVHRDLKPDNVFLESSPMGAAGVASAPPRVRVLDFGIAKVAAREGGAEADAMRLTGTGTPLGTPTYMAPEQWWASGVGPATDQYALGVVLFEMIAKAPPFASQRFPDLVQLHVSQTAPSLASVGQSVPEAVEAIVARLLAKDPKDRFASMAALVEAGDVAFGSALAPAAARLEPPATMPEEVSEGPHLLQRFFSIEATILVLGFVGVLLAGYGGGEDRHDVVQWIRIGGWGQWLLVAYAPLAMYAVAVAARARAETGEATFAGFWIALVPALQGAFTTYTGWRAILRGMPRAAAIGKLSLFAAGSYEANASRFLGFSISALLFLCVAALPGVSGMTHAASARRDAAGLRTRESLRALAVLAALTIAAVLAGAPSAALVAGAAAVAVGVHAALPTIHPDTAPRDETERATASILAVAMAIAAGLTRIEAREASLWVDASTRAERVAGILASEAERDVTVPFALAALAILLLTEGVRFSRLRAIRALRRPTGMAVAFATVAALGATGDAIQHARFSEKRAELAAELGAQFALFAHLDPPSGDALEKQGFAAHRATALQVTRDVVAVDGRGVAKLAALGGPQGVQHVAVDLDRALAQGSLEDKASSEVDLAVSVDRGVDAGDLERLLRIARAAGVRRVEILLTRGASPDLGRGGPADIGIVIPDDFVALPVELGDSGIALPQGRTFGAVAPTLVLAALAAHGPIALAVGANP